MKCLREKGQGPRIDQYFLRSQSSQSNEIQRQEANHSSQDISTPVIDVRRTCMDTVSDEPNDPCEPGKEGTPGIIHLPDRWQHCVGLFIFRPDEQRLGIPEVPGLARRGTARLLSPAIAISSVVLADWQRRGHRLIAENFKPKQNTSVTWQRLKGTVQQCVSCMCRHFRSYTSQWDWRMDSQVLQALLEAQDRRSDSEEWHREERDAQRDTERIVQLAAVMNKMALVCMAVQHGGDPDSRAAWPVQPTPKIRLQKMTRGLHDHLRGWLRCRDGLPGGGPPNWHPA
ncbi:UNVERIFIED_CONTAM: hypothetical protein FKN15_018285 [Acipenser sinensis]